MTDHPAGRPKGRCRDIAPDAAHGLAEARCLFETTGLSLRDIAGRTGLSARALGARARREGWSAAHRRIRSAVRKDKPADRVALLARLWKAAERQVDEVEAMLAQLAGDAPAREREAKVMALLVRVVAGLAAIDGKTRQSSAGHGDHGGDGDEGGRLDGREADDAALRNLDAFRAELAERLARLHRQ